MPWVLRGLRNGILTSRYPRRPDPTAVFESVARPTGPPSRDPTVPTLCPTGAVEVDHGGGIRLDQGRCIGCGACVRERPELFEWAPGPELARQSRAALVVPETAETDEELAAVRRELSLRTRALRRSVHVRHVDTGSDGSEEWEVLALQNPVYDVHRLGIFFTASPRHADVLLVTGAGTHGMAAPLRRTLEAMPNPTVVIAAGTDAISGGLLSPGYAVAPGAVAELVEVDIWVPGSPPAPISLLHALLMAIGRLRPERR
jgi:Ni,Fe-hydrogenase III small subunit/ferredoxin